MAVGLYLLNLEEAGEPAGFLKRAEQRVDAVRYEKALKIGEPKSRAASLGAGLLLQRLARDCRDGICIEGLRHCPPEELLTETEQLIPLHYRFGAHGKPEIEEFPLKFSISHSGSYVICAVSERRIGADIQQLKDTDSRKLAQRFFTESEYKELEKCGESGRQRLFFEMWARKEAYGKLTGEGVIPALKRERYEVCWADFPAPEGYALAVCTAEAVPRAEMGKTMRKITGVAKWDV